MHLNLSSTDRRIIFGAAVIILVVLVAIAIDISSSSATVATPIKKNVDAAAGLDPYENDSDSGEENPDSGQPADGSDPGTGSYHGGSNVAGGSVPGLPGTADPGSPAIGVTPAPGVPPAPGAPPEILNRGVAPQTSRQGDSLIVSAIVGGQADRVIISSQRISDGYVFDVELLPSQSASGYTIWLKVGVVPTALAGEYRYFARAYTADGQMVEMPGTEGYEFRIDPPA